MITADYIVIILILASIIFGSAFGFGKGLKWFTSGTFGKIISVVVCYFLFGIVLNWWWVQVLLGKFTALLESSGSWICSFLLSIRIDLIVFALVLFIVVQILRMIVVGIIRSVMEIKNPVIRVINKFFGVLLFAVFAAVVGLIVFQVIAWVSGADGPFFERLSGSAFGLDYVFANNPLNAFFMNIISGTQPPASEPPEVFVSLFPIF